MEISYKAKGNEMAFVKSGDIWVYKEQPSYPLKEYYVTNMVGVFTNLTSIRTVEKKTENLSEYGLDNPDYIITATDIYGNQINLYIGIQNSVTEDYYAYVDTKEGIYTIDPRNAGYFSYTLNDMADTGSFVTPEASSILKVDLKWEEEELSVETMEGSVYDPSEMMQWFVTHPFSHEYSADTEKVTALINTITDLYFSKLAVFEPTEVDFIAYGLKDSNKKISFRYQEEQTSDSGETLITEQETILWIGNRAENEDAYYVMEEGGDRINTMSAKSIEEIFQYQPNDLIYKYFALVNISSTESVTVESDGIVYTLELGQQDAADTIDPKINEIYQSLIGISAEKVLNPLENTETEKREELSFSITFYRNSAPETVELRFTDYDNVYYLAYVNNEGMYLITKRAYEEYKSAILEGFLSLDE